MVILGFTFLITLCLGAMVWCQRRQLLDAHRQLEAELERVRHERDDLEQHDRLCAALVTCHMRQTRSLLARQQAYQQQLLRLVTTRSLDRLPQAIRGATSPDAELDAFLASFDHTFLTLHPRFVEQLNDLLPPDARFALPTATASGSASLTTELRVFALMRLGVTDTDEIAAFLRCTPKTVLNYRSRLRQHATITRDQLDRWLCEESPINDHSTLNQS